MLILAYRLYFELTVVMNKSMTVIRIAVVQISYLKIEINENNKVLIYCCLRGVGQRIQA